MMRSSPCQHWRANPREAQDDRGAQRPSAALAACVSGTAPNRAGLMPFGDHDDAVAAHAIGFHDRGQNARHRQHDIDGIPDQALAIFREPVEREPVILGALLEQRAIHLEQDRNAGDPADPHPCQKERRLKRS